MLKSYVTRIGRFTDAQKKSYEALAEKYLIPYEEKMLDFSAVFNNNAGVTLEIGFGMGSATALIAEENPDKNYLGMEVHKPGVGKLLWEIEKRELTNIRIIEYDAAIAAEKMITKASLDAIHIFFPDPWPKKKHHKRRLIKRPFTEILSSLLKIDAYLYMVTDWEDYASFALKELSLTSGLRNLYDGFAEPQEWRPPTKFEKKGIEKKHGIYELYFIRE